MSKVTFIAIVGLTLTTLVACGSSDNVEARPAPQGEALNVSLARSYASLDEVVQGSDAVVKVRAGRATTEEIGEIVFTFTAVEILDTVTGQLGSKEIQVVQTGERGSWYVPELPPFLRQGDEYYLAVASVDDFYDIVGTAAWVVDGTQAELYAWETEGATVDGESGVELPQTLPVDELEDQIRNAG